MASTRTGSKGRRVASKACDLCRHRKTKCVFGSGGSSRCTRCDQQGLDCTFFKGHKLRGPRAHRPLDQNVPPLSKVEMEHLCSIDMLHLLVSDFDSFVYPLFPLIHQPTFHQLLEGAMYHTDAAFLRRCLSLCAITVASAPNKEDEYCIGQYVTYQEFVNRACDLVVMSRLATQPGWEDDPSFETAIDSILLSMAAHYIGRTRRGWAFANEAVLIMRDLQLHKPEGLGSLSPVDSECCKRAFWVLHMTQIHDLFISTTSHMTPGFPPRNVHWEMVQLSEEQDGSPAVLGSGLTPAIGFVHITKLVQCARDILTTESYQPCFTSLMPHIDRLGLPSNHPSHSLERPSFARRLIVAREIARRLRDISEVSKDRAPSILAKPSAQGEDVAMVTLQVTSLYFTNTFVEAIFDVSDGDRGSFGRFTTGQDDKIEVWKIRRCIAQRLLDVLQTNPSQTFHLNGFSLVHQIRKIAASLLGYESDMPASVEGETLQYYVSEFAKILAGLDLNAGVSAVLYKSYPDEEG